MIRKLFLVLAVLALVVLTTPGPAHGRGPFPYGPPCWEEGHWIGQRYMDRYGHSIYAPVWVPPRWGCWY